MRGLRTLKIFEKSVSIMSIRRKAVEANQRLAGDNDLSTIRDLLWILNTNEYVVKTASLDVLLYSETGFIEMVLDCGCSFVMRNKNISRP